MFAVVRDPIDRLLSAYRDRVYTKNMDEFENCSWEWFCNNFKDLVLQGTDIGRHCRPQVDWLGRDANRYNTVFYTSDLNNKFKAIVENITGATIPDLFENASNHVNIEMSDEQKSFLLIITNVIMNLYHRPVAFRSLRKLFGGMFFCCSFVCNIRGQSGLCLRVSLTIGHACCR